MSKQLLFVTLFYIRSGFVAYIKSIAIGRAEARSASIMRDALHSSAHPMLFISFV